MSADPRDPQRTVARRAPTVTVPSPAAGILRTRGARRTVLPSERRSPGTAVATVRSRVRAHSGRRNRVSPLTRGKACPHRPCRGTRSSSVRRANHHPPRIAPPPRAPRRPPGGAPPGGGPPPRPLPLRPEGGRLVVVRRDVHPPRSAARFAPAGHRG